MTKEERRQARNRREVKKGYDDRVAGRPMRVSSVEYVEGWVHARRVLETTSPEAPVFPEKIQKFLDPDFPFPK